MLLAKLEVANPHMTDTVERLIDCICSGWRESVLPDTLLGYHVLSQANLSATERATVLTATASYAPTLSTSMSTGLVHPPQLSLSVVEKALLSTWQDRELIERDEKEEKGGRHHQFNKHKKKIFEVDGSSSDDEANELDSDDALKIESGDESEQEDLFVLEGLSNAEDQQAFFGALQSKFHAKNNFNKHKRTFKEA